MYSIRKLSSVQIILFVEIDPQSVFNFNTYSDKLLKCLYIEIFYIFLLANMKDRKKPRRKAFYRLLISVFIPEI